MDNCGDYSYFGYPCCGCGMDCSGMSCCDDCKKDLCFICCNFEHPLTINLDDSRHDYRLCEKCLEKRQKKQ